MPSQRLRIFAGVIVLLLLPMMVFGQLDHISVVSDGVPDFGAVDGTWGHLQYYRPYGIKGIELKDWRDLSEVSLLSGEPFNTDRQGWIPLDSSASMWYQMHPELTAPADTTAASLLVNYKQGDGAFKDFTLWYHNSLDEQTRYGWTSKLRSHPRVLLATEYDEQRHRVQMNRETEEYSLTTEAGYTHQVNPLYAIRFDTTLSNYVYDDTPQIISDRWDGNVEWNNLDSNGTGSEVFASVQAGIWSWQAADQKSIVGTAYYGKRFSLGQYEPFLFKMGMISKQLGGTRRTRALLEFISPRLHWKNLSSTVGIKNIGKNALLPDIDLQFKRSLLNLTYETVHVIEDRTWDPNFASTLLHQISSSLNFSNLSVGARGWQGKRGEVSVSGVQLGGQFYFPWEMKLNIDYNQVNNPADWVFSEKFIDWELHQDFTLFKQALHSHLKVWGKHLLDTRPGILDLDNFQISNGISEGEKTLHLLNYTLSAQVSSVIFSFTDQNMLQDDLWNQYADIPWNINYTLMENQLTQSRFRYLSIIWVFDN
mgnify:CR=1 FL=1